MDFDFVDENRPRVQLQSPSGPRDSSVTSRSLGKVSAGVCASLGVGLIGLGLRWVAGPLQFLAIWFGLSLVVGPFAPSSVTGGDCRVGVGEPVLPEFGDGEDNNAATAVEQRMGGRGPGSSRFKEPYTASRKAAAAEVVVEGDRRSGSARTGGSGSNNYEQNAGRSRGIIDGTRDALPHGRNGGGDGAGAGIVGEDEGEGEGEEEEEWRSEDMDALRKLIVKHPRGTLRRWEVIAEALGGRYSADSVVKMSKTLGQKKVAPGNQDAAYSRFLSQRKGSKGGIAIASPLSQREGMDTSLNNNEEDINAPPSAAAASTSGWTEAEDKALLTALKTFPKETLMRWDKVALAVPGRSKVQCLRRFSDLRKSLHSSTGGGASSSQPESGID